MPDIAIGMPPPTPMVAIRGARLLRIRNGMDAERAFEAADDTANGPADNCADRPRRMISNGCSVHNAIRNPLGPRCERSD
jgi:hypothetical protein